MNYHEHAIVRAILRAKRESRDVGLQELTQLAQEEYVGVTEAHVDLFMYEATLSHDDLLAERTSPVASPERTERFLRRYGIEP